MCFILCYPCQEKKWCKMDNFITIFCISYVLSATEMYFARKKEYSNMQNKEKLIEVLMYNHSVKDLHCVYHELIVHCKKGWLRPSKHTQQTTESSVLPNYNPIGAVKKISEEAKKKKNTSCHNIFQQYCPMVPFKGLLVIKPIQSPCNKYHNYISLLSIAVSMQWLGIDFQLNIWLWKSSHRYKLYSELFEEKKIAQAHFSVFPTDLLTITDLYASLVAHYTHTYCFPLYKDIC